MTLTLRVKNSGVAPSPIALRLYEYDPGPLPIGNPYCPSCNSTTTGGLGWPALALGEERVITAQFPVTGSGNTAFFVSLYAESLATVLANEQVGGIVPGLQDWKISLSIGR